MLLRRDLARRFDPSTPRTRRPMRGSHCADTSCVASSFSIPRDARMDMHGRTDGWTDGWIQIRAHAPRAFEMRAGSMRGSTPSRHHRLRPPTLSAPPLLIAWSARRRVDRDAGAGCAWVRPVCARGGRKGRGKGSARTHRAGNKAVFAWRHDAEDQDTHPASPYSCSALNASCEMDGRMPRRTSTAPPHTHVSHPSPRPPSASDASAPYRRAGCRWMDQHIAQPPSPRPLRLRPLHTAARPARASTSRAGGARRAGCGRGDRGAKWVRGKKGREEGKFRHVPPHNDDGNRPGKEPGRSRQVRRQLRLCLHKTRTRGLSPLPFSQTRRGGGKWMDIDARAPPPHLGWRTRPHNRAPPLSFAIQARPSAPIQDGSRFAYTAVDVLLRCIGRWCGAMGGSGHLL
ncbi:hypothetical protein DFH06DRAFT_618775 [Mycena polygramma]|nr:hypothetical protein DFH06DRAFT_618775 [Mycena polygramma]